MHFLHTITFVCILNEVDLSIFILFGLIPLLRRSEKWRTFYILMHTMILVNIYITEDLEQMT